jgi:hypothetical protein
MPGSGPVAPHHLPAANRSDATSVSRYVERYSRRNAHEPEPAPVSLVSDRIPRTGRPFTEAMRIGTIGTGSADDSPASRSSRWMAESWSGWMSKSTRFGRAGPPVSRSCSSKLSCTSTSVPRRNAPKPIASTTVTVWFDGRCRLERPCRQRYGQPEGSQRRAPRTSAQEAAQSTSSATATPAAKIAP